MPNCCAIYGYECSMPEIFPDFEIIPRTRDHIQARTWARDKTTYNLMAVVVGDTLSDDFAFKLEAVLSFIEHLDVIVTSPEFIEESDLFDAFPHTLPTHGRHDGGGATLMSDYIVKFSRPDFIKKCLSRLRDKVFCDETKFGDLLFKKVETFRQRRPLLEVSYFLLYSGLEAHARAAAQDKSRNASEPIYKLLNALEFDISIDRVSDLKRSVSTYTHLRNALFHNGEVEAVVKISGKFKKLRIIDYFFHLSQLTSLVVMKAVEFDDGHINWDSWIDRKPFK